MNHFRRKPKRRGVILVCVLACLVVVSGLTLAMTQTALAARREARYRMQVCQTEWLLQAGVQRASMRIADSADYRGEVWRCDKAIDRFDDATVQIQVSDISENQRAVTVTSILGGSTNDLSQPASGRTIRAHQFTISVPESSKPE